MIRFIHVICLIYTMLIAPMPSSLFAQGGSQKYSLAVLNLSGGPGSFGNSDAKLITAELTREISRTGLFFTMSDIDMERGLQSKGLDPDVGCTDIGCATRAGRALGVQLVVFGEIRNTGAGYILDAQMLHVASGQIVKSESKEINGEFRNVLEETPGFAQDLMGVRSGGPAVSSQNHSTEPKRNFRPNSSTPKPYESSRTQYYEKDGGSKWLYIGLGALVAGGVGAGVMLLTGDDGGGQSNTNGGTTTPPPGNLGGPPSFP